MKDLKIVGDIADRLARASVHVRRNSPHILVGAGIIGVVASAALACKATLKAKDVVVTAKEKIDDIRMNAEPKDRKKALTGAYLKASLDVAVLYLPSVGLGALSISGIISSHNILSKRNAALAAAYTAIDTTFKEYRGRVTARFGEDVEHAIRYNLRDEVIEETVTDENGVETTVKKTVQVANINEGSDYARYFMKIHQDDFTLGSTAWEKNEWYNDFYISQQLLDANNMLRSHKIVFLNDVYKLLGFMPSEKGQEVGWIYDPKRPVGDDYIEFFIKEVYREDKNGVKEKVRLIDFNVDGPVRKRAKQLGLLS